MPADKYSDEFWGTIIKQDGTVLHLGLQDDRDQEHESSVPVGKVPANPTEGAPDPV